MKTSDMADIVSAKISHVAEPHRYPVSDIVSCRPIDLGDYMILNPEWKEGQGEKGKYITGDKMFEILLKEGWVTLAIGWVRHDDHVNFGQPPSVRQKLIAMMAKLKQE